MSELDGCVNLVVPKDEGYDFHDGHGTSLIGMAGVPPRGQSFLFIPGRVSHLGVVKELHIEFICIGLLSGSSDMNTVVLVNACDVLG